MRTMFFAKKSLVTASLVGLCALSASAGSYTNDFNTDPTSDPNLIIRAPSAWVAAGGADGGGFMSINNAENGLQGTVVLPAIDDIQNVIGFNFRAKVRIGGGTARPADGMSISFADDPGATVGEEGTTTGLSLNFDTWDNGNGEGPAIELKWNGTVVARKRFAGDSESAGPGYLIPETDPVTGAPIAIQTDPPGTGTGGTPVWTDVQFSVTAAGAATVRYKGYDIFRDVIVGWTPRPGRFVIGGRTGNANEAHWIDNIGVTTELGDPPAAFRTSSPAANPAAHLDEFTPISFMIDQSQSFEPIDPASIRLTVDGQDVTSSAVIEPNTPSTGNYTVTYTPGGFGYTPGKRIEAVITFSTAGGVPYTARKELRITEVPDNTALGAPLFIEAEDFNYTSNGVSGLFFDFGSPAGSYNATAAQIGVDYFQGDSNPDSPLYRVLNPPNGIVGIGDNARGSNTISPDFKVGWNGANDAYNFTRTFPNTTYKVYGRFSSGDLALNTRGRSTLSRVISDPGQSNQVIADIGFFEFPSTGGWDTFIGFQPLKDSAGNELIIRLNGLTTLRHTTRPGAYDVNYFAFVPTFTTNVLYPTASLSPANGGQTIVRDNFPIRVTITDADTQVVPSSIRMFFDGVEVTPVTITDTALGAEGVINITSSPSFGSHTAMAIFCDNSSPSVCRTNSSTFTVSPLKSGTNSLFIEAEDFNYSDDGVTGGLHANFGDPSCPTQNKDGILNVDYFEVNDANDGGAVPAYRPATGVEAAKPGTDGFARGDQTITCTYIIGWTDNGDWYNFTRDFGPSVRYNVYARMASGGGAEGARLDRVTSDPTQPNQTVDFIGNFNSPATGNWDTFHFVPLRDAAGTLVNIRLGGLQTLRYTKMPVDSDINYLAFVKADISFIPPQLQSATPAPDSQNAGNVIRAVIRDEDSQVNPASLRLFVDGANVTSTATVTDTANGAEISIPIGRNPLGSTHTVRVEWQDTQSPTPTNGVFQWQFTDFYNGGLNLFIEAEDFNTAGGDFLPSKPGVAFNTKGLYNTLGATPLTDYNDAGDAMESNLYRTEGNANVPHVNMVATPDTTATGGGPRPGFETLPDYKIGWTNPNTDWYHYTRDFGAAADYQIYIRASHGDGTQTIGGALDTLDDPSLPSSTNRLGTFRAPATGGWDTFTFIPLRDSGGQVARIPLSGLNTLRYTVEANGGDINYLMLAPLIPVNPPLSIARSGNNVTVTWSGGRLQSAPQITGPWTDETGATSPVTFNNTTGMRFYRTISP